MRISNTSKESHDRLKILVYGAPGVGKTTLAASLKEKVLVISAEAGLLSLADRDIDVIDITKDDQGKPIPKEKRTDRLIEIFQAVCKAEFYKKYRWLFLDSLTEIGQNMHESLLLIYPDKKDSMNLWGDYSKKATSMVKSFRDLPHYNVVFTGLEKK